MALEKQNMRFLFDAGIDQEINPEDLTESNMQAVINGVFRKRGRIEKRLPLADSLDKSTVTANPGGGAGYAQEPVVGLITSGPSLAVQGTSTVRTHSRTSAPTTA